MGTETLELIVKQISLWVWLGILLVYDLKSRRVPVWPLVLMTVCGSLYAAAESSAEEPGIFVLSLLLRVLPGAVLLLCTLLTGGRIGAADGWGLLALGLYVGFSEAVSSLFRGAVFCAAAGILLLLFKKKKKTDRIAFLPFLAAGYLAGLLL